MSNPEKTQKKLSILLADDHEVLRHGLRGLIEQEPGWKVCAEAGDGHEAIALAERHLPDVVVLDIGMPGLGGLQAAREIKRLLPATELLIFTGDDGEELIHEAFAAGARSYILKGDLSKNLVAAIHALAQHKPYFTSRTSAVVFARYLTGEANSETKTEEPLTPREIQVVQLLGEGRSNKEVSAALGIGVKTVETHRASSMRKLGVNSFAALVRYAIRHKIIAD